MTYLSPDIVAMIAGGTSMQSVLGRYGGNSNARGTDRAGWDTTLPDTGAA